MSAIAACLMSSAPPLAFADDAPPAANAPAVDAVDPNASWPVRRLGPGALGSRPRRRRPRRHLRLPRHLLGRRNPPAFRAGRTLSPPPRPFPPS